MNHQSLAFVAATHGAPTSLVRVIPPLPTLSLLPPRPHCPCTHSTSSYLSTTLFQQQTQKQSEEDEDAFLQQELARIESLDVEHITANDDDDDDDWLEDFDLPNELPDDVELEEFERTLFGMQLEPKSAATLEEALRQGVVPADAGVGSGTLSGDFGWDPLDISQKDYIGIVQKSITNLIPGGDTVNDDAVENERPTALILRDYREAEIRHGRLAMLAAVFWPLQEMLDRLLLDDFGSVVGNLVFGGVTLPYIPLVMTAIMLLLGYLDIFRQQLKESEELGEAFLPGDCFWDPLKILEGAPDSMKRNMQERELFNGRMAMLAIAAYIWEEVRRGQPIISIPGNELLFEPAYQVPYIQEYLDSLFGSARPPSPFPDVDVVEGVSLDDVTGME